MSSQMIQELLIVAAMVMGTMITRFLPFLVFPAGKPVPRFVEFLGRTLPFATMGLLVVYCLKGVQLTKNPYGLPELIAVAVVAALHGWKRNTFLSIGAGTVCYMVLVQLVFS